MRYILTIFLIFVIAQVFGQVRVKGYYRKDGTYVQPHVRSNPDGNPYNNWSYPGNLNPYTGKIAPGDPSTYLDNYYKNRTYQPNSASSSSGNSNYRTYYVSGDKLNVRTGPSTNSAVLLTLSYLDNVKVIREVEYPWCLIEANYYDNSTYSFKQVYGYVSTTYLLGYKPATDGKQLNTGNPDYFAKEKPLYTGPDVNPSNYSTIKEKRNLFYVTANRLNVRIGPSEYDSVFTTIPFQERVEVVSMSEYPWYKIKTNYFDTYHNSYKQRYGYVYSFYLSTSLPVFNTDVENSNLNNSTTLYPISSHPYGNGNGKIAIWTNCYNEGYISIYVDDIYLGKLTVYSESEPDCDTKGLFSITKKPGIYKVTAIGATMKWESTVMISLNECSLRKLSK
jgi:uncharacterized protein YraI